MWSQNWVLQVKSLDGWIGSDLLCRRKTQSQRWSQGTGMDAGHTAGAAACLDKGFDSSWLVFGVGETDVTSAVHGRECGMAPPPGPFGGNLQNGPTPGSSSQKLMASCSHSAHHPFHLQRPACSHSAITCWMCQTSTFLSSAALHLFELRIPRSVLSLVLLFRIQLRVRRAQGNSPWPHHHRSTGSDPLVPHGLTSCPQPQIPRASPAKKESGACCHGRSESAAGLDVGHFPSVCPN